MLSCLGRYPRQGTSKGVLPRLETLERKDRDRVLRMLSLLRIADGLDAGHDSVIGHVGAELSGTSVEIVISGRGDASSSVDAPAQGAALPGAVRGPISLEVVPTGPEEMQALASEETGLA